MKQEHKKIKVKICGITSAVDYNRVVSLGADFVGFIFYPPSPRYIDPAHAADFIPTNRGNDSLCRRVGVFVNEKIETVREIYRRVPLDIVQLHGDETPEYVEKLDLPCWKALRVKNRASLEDMNRYPSNFFLLDTYVEGLYGGTGIAFDPAVAETASKTGKQLIISGGVSSENIAHLFQSAAPPYAVDVNSSLETRPGVKDQKKLERFFCMFKNLASGGQGGSFEKPGVPAAPQGVTPWTPRKTFHCTARGLCDVIIISSVLNHSNTLPSHRREP